MIRQMIAFLRARLNGEEGVGMVTALLVSLIVAGMGASWYSMGVHELDEVSFDAGRTGAINMAEAGAREAMYLLANDSDFRSDAATPSGADSGITAGVCDLTAVDTQIDGVPRQAGEYWYRAVKVDPGDPLDQHYVIEAWGWAPGHASRQAVAKKVVFEVELEPYGGGFYHALFASDGGLQAGNRKEIYGDAYSGETMTIGNFTRVYANDGGYPGDGNLDVLGDFEVTSGSNVEIEGYVKVNGYIDDRKTGTLYRNDVIVLHDNVASPYTATYFESATINETLFVAGPASEVTGSVTAGTEVYDATGIPPVPAVVLPTFTWDATDYSPAGTEWTSWSDFDTWYTANKGNLSGAHHIADASSYVLDFGGAYLDDHFVLAFDGSLTVKKTPTGSALAPAQIVLAGLQSDSDVLLAQSANSIEDVVHHLVVTQGDFGASNQSTMYGALYGDGDISTNRLEIHFRPPPPEAIVGFEFDPSLADQFRPVPGVWREVPPAVDNTGLQTQPSGYYCNLP